MKLTQNRKARYGKTASSALGKPLAFKAPARPGAPNGNGNSSDVNLANSLPRPYGMQSDEPGSSSEIVPLISSVAQEQIVAEQQNYMSSRAEAITQIESHIVEIGQQFGRLSTLIQEQGDMVRRYDTGA
jgi:syntaxin 5